MKYSLEKAGEGSHGRYFFPAVLLAAWLIVPVQLLLPPSLQVQCLFRRWSGVPCPTCGGTRCAQLILEGNFLPALKMQPLIFAVLFLTAGALVYSLAALLFRLPLVRIRLERRGERVAAAGLVIFPVVLNWLYLIWRGG